MRQPGVRILIASVSVAAGQLGPGTAAQPAAITVDYPEDGSIFPPEITAPTFIWHDASAAAGPWRIEVKFSDGSAAISAQSHQDTFRRPARDDHDRRVPRGSIEEPYLDRQSRHPDL